MRINDLIGMPELLLKGDDDAWALFSPCESYRYALGRVWDPSRVTLLACLHNPSTATHETTDPTLRKVCYYARRDGFGGAIIVNAFGLRATDPRLILEAYKSGVDPVGPGNDQVVRKFAYGLSGGTLVAGWGSPKWAPLRARLDQMRVSRFETSWYCWARNKDGHPGHPLYLRNDAPLVPLFEV